MASSRSVCVLALALAFVSVIAVAPSAPAQASPAIAVRSTATAPFPNFESSPVRPLLLSPDGGRLYVLNTPDARVEIFNVKVDAQRQVHLAYKTAVFTGLEPVSMAFSPDDPGLLFVANFLSDSVSVVDLDRLGVVATINVGDEPSDVLVQDGLLYVTTARSAAAPDFVNPGTFVSNAVVIAQAVAPFAILERVEVPGHRPRALASAAGAIHVIPLNSGNHTTVIDAFDAETAGLDQLTLDAHDTPFAVNPVLTLPEFGQLAWLNTSFGVFGWQIPQVGRVVFDHEHPGFVPQLQDLDVIPLQPGTGALLPDPVTGVGTTLFAIATNPLTGDLWIANTDAHNRTRFEPALSGRAFSNRVTVASPQGVVKQVIEFAPPVTAAEHAQPVALAFYDGPAGARAYVACLGDSTVVALDAATGAVVDEFEVVELPVALAVDSDRGLLFVQGKSGHKLVRAYDILAGHAPAGRARELAYDPEPQGVADGRIHLYDARAGSGAGTGNMSCASCHVSGHGDFTAWDLGDPQGGIGYAFPDLMKGVLAVTQPDKLAAKKSIMTHPLKGPMVTQSLRGIADRPGTPLHWRGDRRFFQNFRGAFVGLLGGTGVDHVRMQAFASFVRSLTYAPNPFQPKDRVYTGDAAAGRTLFGAEPGVPGKEYNPAIPGNVTCVDCHGINIDEGNFTGSQYTINFDGESQLFNTGQLRAVYEKEFPHLTGTGLLHDGTIRDIPEFLDFEPPGTSMMAFPLLTPTDRAQISEFVRAWDTGLSPLVGVQYTAAAGSDTQTLYDFLDLAEIQSLDPTANVDLIGKGQVHLGAGVFLPFGVRYGLDPAGSTMYEVDLGGWVTRGSLVSAVASGLIDVTFTCVPPGLGTRLGLDRDEDGLYDGIERHWGTSAARPDTDLDGYDDALELGLGADPLVFDDQLVADTAAPEIQSVESYDEFADTATMRVITGEAAGVLVELGLAPGDFGLGSFSDPQLRRTHELVLSGMPPNTAVSWRVTATDHNGNASTLEGVLGTTHALYHVDEITLEKSGTGPYTVTGTVTVVDQSGARVPNIPVRVLWAGSIGGADNFPLVAADESGVATFVLGPWTPAAPTTVTISPVTVGHPADEASPFYIGSPGDDVTFFYDQPANRVNYRSIDVP